ncbi:MAG: radical SAM family heme chaperone HemW [bacterium]
MDRSLSLYIHFPFCVRKCRYCDFLSGPADHAAREAYLRALEREISLVPEFIAGRPVRTLFFGGGTPSLMEEGQLQSLMEALRSRFTLDEDAEISMEVNPGTADLKKLKAFREQGINRLSIGVQSFCDGELSLLGRIHRAEDAVRIFYEARQAGFDNINLDLMSALPGQSTESWRESLEMACRLGPEHISAYSLIIEEGTPFASMDLPPLPDEDEDRQMYHETGEILSSCGYERYEISNYARPGYACRHNCVYWTCRDYLGLGLGASSLIGNSRFDCIRSMQDYLSAPAWEDFHEEKTLLTVEDRMEEFMFLGLRMTGGIRPADFEERFHASFDQIYGKTAGRHVEEGLLAWEGGRLFLTERGLDLANYVMSDYILDR